MRKLTIEQVKEKLFKVHGDNLLLDESTYINTNIKARFIDKDFPSDEWWAIPNNVLKGHEHIKRAIQKRANIRRTKIEEVIKKIREIHGDTIDLVKETYIDMSTLCKFIDKDFLNDEWWSRPKDVILKGCCHPKRANENRKKTCREIYNVDNVSQNREIHLKAIRSSNKRIVKYNWETNEEIDCQGGWEPKVVDRWNEQKERFKWQIPFENKEEKYTYFVDAYLPDRDVYIEIKGREYEVGMQKWEWFHKEHPNSELWDQKKLKELGII
jgi:hypothetical protein